VAVPEPLQPTPVVLEAHSPHSVRSVEDAKQDDAMLTDEELSPTVCLDPVPLITLAASPAFATPTDKEPSPTACPDPMSTLAGDGVISCDTRKRSKVATLTPPPTPFPERRDLITDLIAQSLTGVSHKTISALCAEVSGREHTVTDADVRAVLSYLEAQGCVMVVDREIFRI